jgi:predicted RNase H-like HicB family nuclease
MNRPLDIKLTMTLIPVPEGGYTAVCNEIRGAISEGKTEEEAIENLKDAVVGVLALNAQMASESLKNYPRVKGKKAVKRPLMELCETV